MQCRASRVPRERSVRYPRHPGGSEVHYKGKYVCTTDGWCQTWSDDPIRRSLQCLLTNVTPKLSDTRPIATCAQCELMTHIVYCAKVALVRVPYSM